MPDQVRNFTPPPVQVAVQKLAEGVYYLTGGTHHSLAIDQRDHIVVVEGPQNEERSLAVIAKVKERQDIDAAKAPAERDALRSELLQQARGTFFAAYMAKTKARLEKDGKIKFNENVVRTLMGG